MCEDLAVVDAVSQSPKDACGSPTAAPYVQFPTPLSYVVMEGTGEAGFQAGHGEAVVKSIHACPFMHAHTVLVPDQLAL